MSCRIAAMCGLLLVVFAGCGKRERIEYVGLSGKVTRGDKPLAKGRITLYPTGTTKGPVSGTEIKAGAYKFETNDGVPAGTHRVAIHEIGPDPKTGAAEASLLPPEFNDRSKLELEIKAGAKSMTKDFDIDKDFSQSGGKDRAKVR